MRKPFTLLTIAFCFSASVLPGLSEEAKPAQVVDPERFNDPTMIFIKKGYQAAKEIPDITAKLFCYCGCDITDKHSTLLDCFTCDHAIDCHICIEEVLIALSMHKKGKSVCEIQYAVDKKYERQYPFDSPSENLKKYRAERLWDAHKKKPKDEPSDPSKKPALKKNKKSGNCCGNEEQPK